jgi:hypothetical protein
MSSTTSSRADPQALAAEGIEAMYRAGDCVAPRLLADVIFDGHRLAREIDSENPAVPLPYRRERMVWQPAPAVHVGDTGGPVSSCLGYRGDVPLCPREARQARGIAWLGVRVGGSGAERGTRTWLRRESVGNQGSPMHSVQ